MDSSSNVDQFLAEMKRQGRDTVNEQPKLDLDLYIRNYTGRTRFDRLLFIGKTSRHLCADALKAAVREALEGQDTSRYREAWDCMRKVAPEEPEALRKDEWINAQDKANKVAAVRLEAELKGYKNNLIKESIRMGHDELGSHFESIGSLSEALDCYTRMRSDITSTKQIFLCSRKIIAVALQQKSWNGVISNAAKVNNVTGIDDQDSARAYIKAATGIAYLGMGKYEDAARSFLNVDSSVKSQHYDNIASSTDLAMYGGLLALATMDKKAIQQKVLDDQNFRGFLEHEPYTRKAITLFINGRYPQCLSILESIRTDALLDIYFSQHVESVFSRIRQKCIEAYFLPFSCVSLETLNTAFARTGMSVEQELVKMIRSGSLKARIDAKEKTLIALRPDPRLDMQRNALDVARKYEEEATERLRRLNIIAAGLEIKRSDERMDRSHFESTSLRAS